MIKGGERIGINKKLLILAIILILMNITVISAKDVDNINTTVSIANDLTDSVQSIDSSNVILSDSQSEKPDLPDLVDNEHIYVYSSNIGNYFTNGVLDNKYEGKKLIFSGDFDNMGQLVINRNDVSIIGSDAFLRNTVFELGGKNITLKNLNFDLTKPVAKNKGSAILFSGNDLNLVNLSINYIVPNDVEAYAILADVSKNPTDNLKIINSTIYFEGHNANLDKYNCAVKLINSYDAIMENNTIRTSLPLKDVNYITQDANIDSDYVFSVGIENCDGFIFNNNTIVSEVNKRPAVKYPTLGGFMISRSNNVLVSNNSIYMSDFVTYPGIENYLYGIDVHGVDNLKIIGNKISMVTTGGKLALGTAYPIQVSGPASEVNITRNNLYSFSNGPNIGVYSQNFFGETYIYVTYNKINVTGLAGVHDWALVTGIESQDTYSEINNNEIEVHSVDNVGINDNLYAISYRQSIAGDHAFEIKDNFAVTDGYYAVYILDSHDSVISNNILVSYNDGVSNGDNAYSKGNGLHEYSEDYDNRVIRAIDYYSSRNKVDGESLINIYDSGSSDIINTNNIPGKSQQTTTEHPLIPGFADLSGVIQQSDDEITGFINDGASFDMGESDAESSDVISQDSNIDNEVFSDSEKVNDNIDGNNLAIVSNSSSTASVGVSSNPLTGSQSGASQDGSDSVSKKAYEIEELMEHDEKFIPPIFFIVAALILLIVGYRRKEQIIE
ncbi:hypothetical protein [uncultured Methanobrevibacter sp.]|uniref:hypothetical protein n=1 Tax=uncultured Methanobrevibacter sp. TaxID=253161 RepID=UPI0025E6A046|nr:hypothetical protein [uncultured Methanobrevibacter sp.]